MKWWWQFEPETHYCYFYTDCSNLEKCHCWPSEHVTFVIVKWSSCMSTHLHAWCHAYHCKSWMECLISPDLNVLLLLRIDTLISLLTRLPLHLQNHKVATHLHSRCTTAVFFCTSKLRFKAVGLSLRYNFALWMNLGANVMHFNHCCGPTRRFEADMCQLALSPWVRMKPVLRW